jgi:hypothetical protein
VVLVLVLAGVTGAALALSLTGLLPGQSGQPGGRNQPQALAPGPATPPRGVITQARARQRRRHRNIIAGAAATGAEAAGRAAGSGSPPRHGQQARQDPSGHGAGAVGTHQTSTGSTFPEYFQFSVARHPGWRPQPILGRRLSFDPKPLPARPAGRRDDAVSTASAGL